MDDDKRSWWQRFKDARKGKHLLLSRKPNCKHPDYPCESKLWLHEGEGLTIGWRVRRSNISKCQCFQDEMEKFRELSKSIR